MSPSGTGPFSFFGSHGHPRYSQGGGEVASYRLCQEYRRQGHRVFFLARGEHPVRTGDKLINATDTPDDFLINTSIGDWFTVSCAESGRMQMQIISSENSQAQSIVVAALVRSFTPSIFDTTTDESVAAVWLNPREMEIPQVQALLVRGGKVLALGCPDVGAAGFLGLSAENLPTNSSQWSDCPVCTGDPTESPVLVTYAEKGLGAWAGLAQRALCRFDFQNEWNTLGFGRISGGSGSPWSLACLVREGEAEPVAVLRRREDGIPLSWYAALREVGGGAILWYNRLVGPVDSVEWRLVERFFSDYRKDTLRCLPCLEELPFGCPGMRLQSQGEKDLLQPGTRQRLTQIFLKGVHSPLELSVGLALRARRVDRWRGILETTSHQLGLDGLLQDILVWGMLDDSQGQGKFKHALSSVQATYLCAPPSGEDACKEWPLSRLLQSALRLFDLESVGPPETVQGRMRLWEWFFRMHGG